MALTVTKKPSITDIPEDTYPAVCVGIFDIGTVDNPRFNKKQEKVIFEFELPDLPNAEGWPRTKTEEWSATLDDRSHLKRHLQSWRGKSFTPEELRKFNILEFLGKPCQIQIVHNRGRGEKSESVYANVGAVLKPARGQVGPEPQRKPIYFDFSEGKTAIPEGVAEFIAAKIQAAPEYAALKAGKKPGAKPSEGAGANKPPAEVAELVRAVGLSWPYSQSEVEGKFDPAKHGGDEEYNLLMNAASDADVPF